MKSVKRFIVLVSVPLIVLYAAGIVPHGLITFTAIGLLVAWMVPNGSGN